MAASRLFTGEGWVGNTVTMTTGSFPSHWLLLHIIYHRLILARLVISADSGLNMPNGWPLKSPMVFATSDASTSPRFHVPIFTDSSFQKLRLTSSNYWARKVSSRWVCLQIAILFFSFNKRFLSALEHFCCWKTHLDLKHSIFYFILKHYKKLKCIT